LRTGGALFERVDRAQDEEREGRFVESASEGGSSEVIPE
jgi:hypothetical protein